MKQSQIVLYVVFGLIIFLVILGLATFTLQLFTAKKVISSQDINQYANNCLDLSLKCALYTQGTNMGVQSLNEIKISSQNYIKKSLNLCFGDLSQKFNGNKFKIDNFTPELSFSKDSTNVLISRLGEVINGGNIKKSLEGYASKIPVALSTIHDLLQSIKNNQKEKQVQNINPRFKLSIYQIDDSKEAIIVTDSLSKINGKEYKMVFAN